MVPYNFLCFPLSIHGARNPLIQTLTEIRRNNDNRQLNFDKDSANIFLLNSLEEKQENTAFFLLINNFKEISKHLGKCTT